MTEIERGKRIAPEDTYRIMIVDGQSVQLDQIKEACKNAGQEVVSVTLVDEAKEFLTVKDNVDVIVAEAFLKEDNIFELLKLIKEDPHYKEVPVILMASEPGVAGQQFIESIEHIANILGVYRFVYMQEFDLKRLMLEIRVVLADAGLPKKEQHGKEPAY